MTMVTSAGLAKPVLARPGALAWPRVVLSRLVLSRLALVGGFCFALSSGGIALAQCTTPAGMGATTIRTEQRNARAMVEITRPNSAGRKAEVEYNDEVFSTKFDADGKARMAFVLGAALNEITVRLTESPVVTCKIEVPDFNKIYRVTLMWRDTVKLDLDVVEPGRRPGGFGHVNRSRANNDLSQGLGQIDIVTDAVDEGATSQVSYVLADATNMPAGSVLGLKLDYITRGGNPAPPYCGDHPKASIPFEVITLDRGQTKRSIFSVGRARCGEPLGDNVRLMRIRQ